MNLPEIGPRKRLQRQRRKSGYTSIRVSKVTRALLTKLETQYDEPLDALVFYLAAHELGYSYAAIISVLDTALKSLRRGVAPAARR
ncbi:MAG TPA: hypothetical protein VKA60_27615 [Blastocatellia bacterium]|nr:hypothetical protein [Blastocatellia bacterium]